MLDEASKRRVKELCDLIAKEQDHHRFSQLLAELNQVLDGSNSTRKQGGQGEIPVPISKKSPSV